MWVLAVIRVLLALLSLRGRRWAYVAFMILGLLYFPLRVSFRFDPHPCELVFGIGLAVFSLTKNRAGLCGNCHRQVMWLEPY